jgi:hypothetical protein
LNFEFRISIWNDGRLEKVAGTPFGTLKELKGLHC